jgi:4-hydroxy-2-oxoheptanedioate aldolase
MQLPINRFKQALRAGKAQIGLWIGLANPYTAEICAGADFDWLLLDAEHAPNDLQTLLAQLQAVAAYPVHPVVRIPSADVVRVKQVMDLGVQTLLVPIIETVEQAREMVRAMRYPPEGIRGVGSALARASRWNRISTYLQSADEQACLLVQIETKRALDSLEAIARVDGVDGVFIGPADLSASLGYRGQPGHPDVQRVIEDAIATVRQTGKAVGILNADEALARRYLELGCTFVAVGVDTTLLARAADTLARKFKKPGDAGAAPPGSSGPYG